MAKPSEEHRDPQSPSARIAAGLAKLGLVFRHEAWRSSGERGLTPTQSQILSTISSEQAPLGLKAVAERLAITMATASEAVSTLVEKELLSKTRSSTDARAVVLKLTAKGKRQAAYAGEWPVNVLHAADSLPMEDQAGLVRGLIGMIRVLQENGAVPTAKMCVGCRFFRPNEHRSGPKTHHCDYIKAPIGDVDLRLDCPEMEPVTEEAATKLWQLFVRGERLKA